TVRVPPEPLCVSPRRQVYRWEHRANFQDPHNDPERDSKSHPAAQKQNRNRRLLVAIPGTQEESAGLDRSGTANVMRYRAEPSAVNLVPEAECTRTRGRLPGQNKPGSRRLHRVAA